MINSKLLSVLCLTCLLLGLSRAYQTASNNYTAQIKYTKNLSIASKELSMEIQYSPDLFISIPWGNQLNSIPHYPYETVSLSGLRTELK